ncbi:hypothetical protein N7520_004680 [Penicillium odoratum]|uniref:uncharacterized protein n=1 Tax=Penicillium odoratum TaxID=1167516 RepID=UPI002547B220|nr:uncharacterized protein N7520_004680 [Penicillium odoratum]KAJ5765121.1 hypothetical protein N7520_004680 [Penicillium odoratum]
MRSTSGLPAIVLFTAASRTSGSLFLAARPMDISNIALVMNLGSQAPAATSIFSSGSIPSILNVVGYIPLTTATPSRRSRDMEWAQARA